MCLVLHLGMLLFTDNCCETTFRFSQYSILATDKRLEGPWVQVVTPPCFVMFPVNLCGFSFYRGLRTSQHYDNFIFLPVPSNCQGVTSSHCCCLGVWAPVSCWLLYIFRSLKTLFRNHTRVTWFLCGSDPLPSFLGFFFFNWRTNLKI